MYQFNLPDVGEGIHEAEILRWLVAEGDAVSENQPILEIQTDKAVVEIPSPKQGTVAKIYVKAGALAQVGDALLTIQETETNHNGPLTTKKRTSTGQNKPVDGPHVGIAGPGQRVLAAPAVRKLARELDIDLTQTRGSGPAGRLLPEDIRRAAARQKEIEADPDSEPSTTLPPEPLTGSDSASADHDEEPLQGLRRRIAERMALAWRTIPHVTVFEQVDASQLVRLRTALKPEATRQDVTLTYTPFIIKAVVQSLRAHPYFNAWLDMERRTIIKHRVYHVGVATAVPDGLLVPVVRHANRLTVLALAAELSRLAALAAQRNLTQEEMSGSTFSLTNFGSLGSSQATPIINPPEVAILGCGKIAQRPIAVEGQLAVRPVLPLALSFDHRLLDGAAAAEFMSHLQSLLANPSRLMLEMA